MVISTIYCFDLQDGSVKLNATRKQFIFTLSQMSKYCCEVVLCIYKA